MTTIVHICTNTEAFWLQILGEIVQAPLTADKSNLINFV